MSKVSVRLEDVRKEFDDVLALEDINLEVQPGELLVLLGPSGCGKSTTLRIIAGLELPTSGRVYMNEEDVTQTMPQDRDLSMVFQNYALYPHKSVGENLKFPLEKMEMTADEREERVMWAAELLGISELLDRNPSELSGGQRQRVALGRTIVREPGLFLMDEPLSNLDAELRVNTRSELRNLQQELGTTTVYVTHDQEEAMSIADRLVIMNDGEIVQVGTPREVYREPKTQFVASFLGEPSMNFIPAHRGPNDELILEMDSDIPLDLELPRESDVQTVGIRPEDVFMAQASNGEVTATRTIPMHIETIDPLGYTFEVMLSKGNDELIGLFEEPPPGIDEDIEVYLDREGLYAFDANGNTVEVYA